MRALLLLMTAVLRGRTNAGGRHASREDYLKVLVILMIALVAGPDIVAAIELTALLEILGAAMVLLSFAIGLKLMGVVLAERLRTLLLPAQYVMLTKTRGLPTARVHGVLLICKHNLALFCLVLAGVVSFIQLAQLNTL